MQLPWARHCAWKWGYKNEYAMAHIQAFGNLVKEALVSYVSPQGTSEAHLKQITSLILMKS